LNVNRSYMIYIHAQISPLLLQVAIAETVGPAIIVI
jgi:hypothetical protein